jgi:hypothetical protein
MSVEPRRNQRPRRNLRPGVASRSKWARIEALLRNRAFVLEYASARERWRNGIPAVFPPAPTGCSGSRRCQYSKHDSSGSLKIAQSIAVRDVPTLPGASGAWSRPRIGH